MKFEVGQKITIKDMESGSTFLVDIVHVSERHKQLVVEDFECVDVFKIQDPEGDTWLYLDRLRTGFGIVPTE